MILHFALQLEHGFDLTVSKMRIKQQYVNNCHERHQWKQVKKLIIVLRKRHQEIGTTNSNWERYAWYYLVSIHSPLTVTYSLEIYTPNTNIKNLLKARVQIVGEEFMQTERKTVIDLANRPETEVQRYVKYQIPDTVFYHISKLCEGS